MVLSMLGALAVLHTAYAGASRLHEVVLGKVKLEASTAPVDASRMYGDSGEGKLTQSCAPTIASAGGDTAAAVVVSTTGDVGVQTDAPLLMSAAATATL